MDGLVVGMEELVRSGVGSLVNCEFVLEPELCHVRGDATQLELAVLNLAINGRDAMPEGGTLRIATRGVTLDGSDIDLAAGAYVELSVEDTWSGMPPEVVARALEPFFTTKDVGAGTGLGLSMALGVATESGGTLRLRSTVGEGTCVTFLLPCTSPNRDTESPVLRGHSVPSDDLSGLRIAAVDDDPDVRQFVADCVMQQGADCGTFDGGHSFLARFAPSQWDIVLIDFAMPG